MTTNIQQIAESFSRHQFTEVFPHLAPNVRWVSVGQSILEGRDAVVQSCEDAARELAGASTEFERFITVVGTDTVAVDAIGRYVDAEGTSLVSSCDIYEFDQGQLTSITSYAVELPLQ